MRAELIKKRSRPYEALARSLKLRAAPTEALLLSDGGLRVKRPAGFDWRAFSLEAFQISHRKKPESIRLLFSAHVPTYIRERLWHPSQILRKPNSANDPKPLRLISSNSTDKSLA